MAHVTVRLQVSDYSQLSDYIIRLQPCRLIRAKYSSLCTNIAFEEIVIVMITIMIIYFSGYNVTSRSQACNATLVNQAMKP